MSPGVHVPSAEDRLFDQAIELALKTNIALAEERVSTFVEYAHAEPVRLEPLEVGLAYAEQGVMLAPWCRDIFERLERIEAWVTELEDTTTYLRWGLRVAR